MTLCKIVVTAGTRPELIKMQPILKEIATRNNLSLLFLHTSQHYDWNMSDSFIEDLELPKPDIFLKVRSGSHGSQTARIISRSEKLLKREKPDIVLVQGDTNSALGVALAASKLRIPVGHVEAGCRSFDRRMPEEINRVLIADLASTHFAPTCTCVRNLLKEGIPESQIYLTGHPIVDVLNGAKRKINSVSISKFGLSTKEYYLATLHRQENVDNKDTLASVLNAFQQLSKHKTVFFSMHPRTCKFVKKFGLNEYLEGIVTAQPVSYFEALSLILNARATLTDSGGIQQESALLRTPCVTMRNTFEWVETVDSGVNFVSGNSTAGILSTVTQLENNMNKISERFKENSNIFGKVGVAKRIVDIIENLTSAKI